MFSYFKTVWFLFSTQSFYSSSLCAEKFYVKNWKYSVTREFKVSRACLWPGVDSLKVDGIEWWHVTPPPRFCGPLKCTLPTYFSRELQQTGQSSTEHCQSKLHFYHFFKIESMKEILECFSFFPPAFSSICFIVCQLFGNTGGSPGSAFVFWNQSISTQICDNTAQLEPLLMLNSLTSNWPEQVTCQAQNTGRNEYLLNRSCNTIPLP